MFPVWKVGIPLHKRRALCGLQKYLTRGPSMSPPAVVSKLGEYCSPHFVCQTRHFYLESGETEE